MSSLVRALGYLAIVILLSGFVIGIYHLGKYISYSFWYEDMVRQTVKEMVRDEALRK